MRREREQIMAVAIAFATRVRLWRGRPGCLGIAGNVAVEFALVLPVLLMMLLASVELGRFLLLNQKVDRIAGMISDLVARADSMDEQQLADIFTAAGFVAHPFSLAERGVVIVSAVLHDPDDGLAIAWQRQGGGGLGAASDLGAEGAVPSLNDGFTLRSGETTIVAEVFYQFAPLFGDLVVAPRMLYRRALHRPRVGALEQLS